MNTSRREVIVMMYAAAGAAVVVALASAQAGGWWLLLSLPAWCAAAYATVRGSELLHAHVGERKRP